MGVAAGAEGEGMGMGIGIGIGITEGEGDDPPPGGEKKMIVGDCAATPTGGDSGGRKPQGGRAAPGIMPHIPGKCREVGGKKYGMLEANVAAPGA